MSLPKFDYYSPRSLDEAVEWLSEHKDDGVKILAGGTDLLVDIRPKIIPDGHRPRCQLHRSGPWQARHIAPEPVKILMALSRIPGLRGISDEGDRVRIGAMTTHNDLERSTVVRHRLTGLWDGSRQLGSPLCRNRGTYGGNLCNARPAADTSIPTLALKGKLALVSTRGERIIDHEDFVTGPGQTVIEPDEILKEVIFDLPSSSNSSNGIRNASAYIKLANRKALEIAVVGAAAAVTFQVPDSGLAVDEYVIQDARISLGAVAPRPLLVPEAGRFLSGKKLTRETMTQAARIAAETAKPITDHRGGSEYRRLMVEVLVRRVLKRCIQRSVVDSTVEIA